MSCGHFPLTGGGARMAVLQAVCALAEHGQLNVCLGSEESSAARIVRAVLRNTRSFSNLGGVAGLPRSLNSVYAAAVALFLDAGFRGRLHRRIIHKRVDLASGVCVALTRDGCTLIASDNRYDALQIIDAHNGLLIRTVGSFGCGTLMFRGPRQIWVAPDDYVFVAERQNRRVQVLTPRFEFHGFIQTECYPFGVCANHDIVAVSEVEAHRISIYGRQDGTLRYRFGCQGSGEGELSYPLGLCFLADGRQIACAEYGKNRVSVFSVQGEFVRHVSCIDLVKPFGLACSASNELFVAAKSCVVVFTAAGEHIQSIKIDCDHRHAIALHNCTLYAYLFFRKHIQVLT